MTQSTLMITGANRGIGLELTRQFAADGWQVLACCRDPGSADALRTLAAAASGIEIHALDVTDYDQLHALSASLSGRAVDVLVSNAGIYGPREASFGAVPAAQWREVFEVNTIAPMMLVQAFVEQVAASERRLIAVVSSKMGSIGDNGSGGAYIYRSSKTAVNQVVKSLSVDLADRAISAITLHPGWVRTDMGGPDGEISVAESAAGLKRILETAGPAQSGQFIEYDGASIPW